MPQFSAYAGNRIDGGFCGKYWEDLRRFGSFWVYCRQRSGIVRGGWGRCAGAIVCVGNGHYPAYSSPERSVYRLQRALPASQYFPNPPKSSQFYRAAPRRSPTTAYRMPLCAAYARLRYTTPWQAGSIYLNSQRPYSRKRATSRLLCQKQALHIFTRRRRTSRSQRNADCTNSWRQYFTVYYRLLPLVTVKPPSTVQPGLPRPPCNST